MTPETLNLPDRPETPEFDRQREERGEMLTWDIYPPISNPPLPKEK